MRRVAVTGGMAEGKSTVMRYIRDLGIPTLSADDVAREVFGQPGVQAAIASLLGVGGPIDAPRVRSALLADPSKRRELNAIMHPGIVAGVLASEALVIEVPLLIETCLHPRFSRVWVVTCGPEEQLRRLTSRVGSEREARELLAWQLPTAIKCAFADLVIRTNAPEADVQAYVTGAIRRDVR